MNLRKTSFKHDKIHNAIGKLINQAKIIAKEYRQLTGRPLKARVLLGKSISGQRIGSIRFNHEWDTVMLVLLDKDFEPISIYEAQRREIEAALTAPGSIARNKRGALSVSKFQKIGKLIWKENNVIKK